MSRVGKMPIVIPESVKVAYSEHNLVIKGKNGELIRHIHPDIDLEIKQGMVVVTPNKLSKKANALHGLTRSLIANMITGVTKGFERVLEINGVGYRAELKGDTLTFNIGYSHPVVYKLPQGVSAAVEKLTRITLSGIDKELIGLTAAKIRSLHKPEPYKGKGIKYAEEHIRRKSGKSVTKA